MAQTVLLSAVLLSVLLSSHGALGISGCRISKIGLEKYGLSTKDYWANSLQGPISLLPAPVLPGLVSCRFDMLTCDLVRVVMRPPSGVDAVVCFGIQIKCLLLLAPVTVRAAFCATVRMKVIPLGLAVDSCSAEYKEITIDPLISLELSVVAPVLASLLDPVICREAPDIAVRLNIIMGFNLQPAPFFTGCQYICTRPYPPQLTSTYIDFPFVPQMTCGGTLVPWPSYAIYYPPPTVIPDGNACFFLNQDDLGHSISTLRARELFNQEITLTTVTTTLIMSHIPEIVCPTGLSVSLRFLCTSISTQFIANIAVFNVVLNVEIGYYQSGFVPLMELIVKTNIIFLPSVDCSKGLLVFRVDSVSDLQITTTCSGVSCTVQSSLIEEMFTIQTLCRNLFNEKLRGGIPWPYPINTACSVCHGVTVIEKFAMWCCDLNLLL